MDREREDYRDLDRRQRRSVDWGGVRRRLRPAVVPLLVLCIPVTGLFGFCAGALWEGQRMSRSKFERDRDVMAPVLAADPAFSRVEIHPNSAGGIELEGEVPTTADGERLRAAFVQRFGETQLWRMSVLVRETGKGVSRESDVPPTR
jgi:hypothetical protein